MGELFGRRARITVGVPGEGAKVFDSGIPPARGLRVAFSIPKSLKSSLNEATVQVWNLSDSSRNRIRDDRSLFLVEAGYQSPNSPRSDQDIYRLFKGQVTNTFTERRGPSRVTTIECLDGFDAVQESELQLDLGGGEFQSISFAKGTAIRSVIRLFANQLTLGDDVAFGDIDIAIDLIVAGAERRGQPITLKRKLIVDGRAADWLDRFGRQYRFDWSIQDGVLELHLWDEVWVGDEITVAKETILGQPSQNPRSTMIDGVVSVVDGVRFRALLQPKVRPGAIVTLESDIVPGRYRVENAVYRGDSDGGPWEVEAEAFVIPGITT